MLQTLKSARLRVKMLSHIVSKFGMCHGNSAWQISEWLENCERQSCHILEDVASDVSYDIESDPWMIKRRFGGIFFAEQNQLEDLLNALIE